MKHDAKHDAKAEAEAAAKGAAAAVEYVRRNGRYERRVKVSSAVRQMIRECVDKAAAEAERQGR